MKPIRSLLALLLAQVSRTATTYTMGSIFTEVNCGGRSIDSVLTEAIDLGNNALALLNQYVGSSTITVDANSLKYATNAALLFGAKFAQSGGNIQFTSDAKDYLTTMQSCFMQSHLEQEHSRC